MATAATAAQAAALYAEYQEITSAIAMLNAGGSGYGLVVQDGNGASITVRIPNLPTANLLTFLTNHQTAIVNALTALGFTMT